MPTFTSLFGVNPVGKVASMVGAAVFTSRVPAPVPVLPSLSLMERVTA